MKKLLFLTFLLISKATLAQIVIDTNVINVYKKAVKEMGNNSVGALVLNQSDDDSPAGFAIFSIYQVDTLNKNELINLAHTSSASSDIKISNGEYKSANGEKIFIYTDTRNEYINRPVLTGAIVDKDTILLQSAFIFYPHVTHKIINGTVKSTYSDAIDSDTVSNANSHHVRQKRPFTVVHTSEFKLSTLKFTPGQIIYGEVEFTTDPYEADDQNFMSKHIKKSLHCKYVFKVSVFENADLLSVMDKN